MGLLFPFATNPEDYPFFEKKDNGEVILKTFGLPYIFWGYLAATLIVLVPLVLLAIQPLQKMLQSDYFIDRLLVYFTIITLVGGLIFLFSLFSYQKMLLVSHDPTHHSKTLTIIHKLFGVPVVKKTIQLHKYTISVEPHHTSPNIAKIKNEPGTRGFQNQGYFVLSLIDNESNKKVFIDRHNNRTQLQQIAALL